MIEVGFLNRFELVWMVLVIVCVFGIGLVRFLSFYFGIRMWLLVFVMLCWYVVSIVLLLCRSLFC